jgi:dolichyl-phosphate beta-glucosyltransferase
MASACLVIPCFNEATRLDTAAFDAFLRDEKKSQGVSLVLVDDGSSDGTLSVLQALAAKHPERIRALGLPQNQGKAEAVRQGMLLAMAAGANDYAGFWDADLATPLDALEMFVATFERNAKLAVVFGARVALLGRNIERRASRHYSGRVFATAASMVLGLAVYDTQCGAKLFKNDARGRALFAKPFGSRWIFDVELLARYLKANPGAAERELYELPLDEWRDIGGSKVRATDFIRSIGDMAAIHRAYRLPGPWRYFLDGVTSPLAQYAGTGAIGTALHYAALISLVSGGLLTPVPASTIGAVLGAAVNTGLASLLTRAGTKPLESTLPRFLAVSAAALGLNALVLWFGLGRLPGHYLAAQLMASCAVLVFGFLVNRRWHFGEA